MTETVRRALSAYYRTAGDSVPEASASREQTHAGKRYVVLGRQDESVLAVYRIKPDGLLRRMRRWPEALGAVTMEEESDAQSSVYP